MQHEDSKGTRLLGEEVARADACLIESSKKTSLGAGARRARGVGACSQS